MNAACNNVASKSEAAWWWAPLAVCALLTPPALADAVQRCEDASGRITYSNETCPPGTRRSRAVDTSEPVTGAARPVAPVAEKADDKALKDKVADKADKTTEKSADKAADKTEAKTEAKADTDRAGDKSVAAERRARTSEGKLAARSVQIDRTPSAPSAPVSVRKDALCRELGTRARFARQDLDSAAPGQRASAELTLRRVQEDYDAECKTR